MKVLILGLLLIATSLAYPVAENEENKSGVPLVITDYSTVTKSDEINKQHQQLDSSESSSSSSSEEDNGEIRPTETSKLEENNSSESSEQKQENRPLLDEKPIVQQDENIAPTAAPAAELPKPLEEKPLEKIFTESKPTEKETPIPLVPSPEIKKEELPKETLSELKKIDEKSEIKESISKSILGDVIGTSQQNVAVAEEPAPIPSVKSSEESSLSSSSIESSTEKVEKPLALPTLSEEKPIEIKDELIAASLNEQKVEVAPAAQEQQPELKSLETPTATIEEKKEADAPIIPAAALSPVPAIIAETTEEKKEILEEKKKAKAEAEPQLPESTTSLPTTNAPISVSTLSSIPLEPSSEQKLEDVPAKSEDLPKPSEQTVAEPLPEKPQQPSASS